jgi:hypothetical protein
MAWAFTLLTVLGVFSAAILTWRGEVELFFNSEGFRPTDLQTYVPIGLALILVVALSLFSLTMEAVKADYLAFQAARRTEATPPTLEPPPPDAAPEAPQVSPQQAMISCYVARGFYRHSLLNETSGDPDRADTTEVWTADEEIQDEVHWYRRPGVIVYEDDSATQFSVAVIHDADSWANDDALKVQRQMMGRPVRIATALNRPLMRQLVEVNDYVLGLGLASHESRVGPEHNTSLAHARRFNIGRAIFELGLKSADRVHGYSIGYALNPPSTPELEPRQRAVVVLGVNASRDVVVHDVLRAAARIVRLEGVTLEQYSLPISGPVHAPSVTARNGYERVEDVSVSTDGTGYSGVLPAIPQEPACAP